MVDVDGVGAFEFADRAQDLDSGYAEVSGCFHTAIQAGDRDECRAGTGFFLPALPLGLLLVGDQLTPQRKRKR